jgi:hypothetical protein
MQFGRTVEFCDGVADRRADRRAAAIQRRFSYLLTLPLPLPLWPCALAEPLPLADPSLTLALLWAEQPATVRRRTKNAAARCRFIIADTSTSLPSRFHAAEVS